MTLIIGVVSKVSGRGKTALLEKLISRFTAEGFKVATVKHINESFDTAKKDTWRHLEAGADETVAATPEEIVSISRSENPSLEEVLEVSELDSDLILVEGYKKSAFPKILCAETADEAKKMLNHVSNIIMISGRILNSHQEKERIQREHSDIPVCSFEEMTSRIKEMLVQSTLRELPGLNCQHCGYDSCLDLAKAIIAGKAKKEDCQVLSEDNTILTVDGEGVPIGKFPQKIIRNVVRGILDSLKDVKKNPNTVELTINIEDKNHE
ncbi:MAG: molybdopterin-guanine dinucleotide biosynthesis protein B [Thermoproteota archaeon]